MDGQGSRAAPERTAGGSACPEGRDPALPVPPSNTRPPEAEHRRVDALIAAALRGKDSAWVSGLSEVTPQTFLSRAAFHGVEPLLLQALPSGNAPGGAVREELKRETVFRLAHEMRHKQVLAGLIGSMYERGVRPLIMKGTALAYTLYPAPELRSRCDTDLLVSPEHRAQAQAALGKAGFRLCMELTGTGVSNEAGYVHRDNAGLEHFIDLHCKINNSEVFSNLFPFGELSARAAPLSGLGRGARALGRTDALLHACFHRLVYPQIADRLVWLYDIHLLSAALTPREWDELVRLARAKGLAEVCRDGIEQARRWLDTPCPGHVLDALAEPRGEPLAAYVRAGPVGREWMDFRARKGLAAKLRYVRTACLPSAEFMRHEYPNAHRAMLPWLYVRRATGGIWKRARASGGRS